MEVLGHEFEPNQWRLFIDSSKVSLKVALHSTAEIDSPPFLWLKIKYNEFKWKLCGDLKVVALLLGKQLGCTKYCCFLCE